MKLLTSRVVVSAVFLLCMSAASFADMITFTGLSANGSAIPNGYAGFQWNNFDLLNRAAAGDTSSFQSFAVNGGGRVASFSSSAQFGLASAWLSTQWNTHLNVELVGLFNGKPIHSMLVDLRGGAPVLITPNWTGIDQIRFVPRGQASAPGSTQFALSNIVVDEAVSHSTPEPSTLLLLLVPGLSLAATQLRMLRVRK